jgi:hypothetical protein
MILIDLQSLICSTVIDDQSKSFIDWTNKRLFHFSLDHFYEPVGWLRLTQNRETLLAEIQILGREGLFCNSCPRT